MPLETDPGTVNRLELCVEHGSSELRIQTLDTTLRDGTQSEDIKFRVEDKLLIAQKLDDFGVDYVEAGWPAADPRDREFFARARELKLRHARLTAFGPVRFPRNSPESDPGLTALLEAGTPTVTLFGKSWDVELRRAHEITEKEYLALIFDSVRFLKLHDREVIYDAKHFFDGYGANPAFALHTLEAAKQAGADVICLCDTNGGTLTPRLAEVCGEVRKRFEGVLGIHAHNDADLAVANALAAVEQGFTHVQGSINGYGERCGTANLCSLIAALELKLGHTTIGREHLRDMTSVSRYVAEIANVPLRDDQPYVGRGAFAHGQDPRLGPALADSTASEHVRAEAVGNRRRMVWRALGDRECTLARIIQFELSGQLSEQARRELADRIESMEWEGYDLEAADGTFELLVREALDPGPPLFEVADLTVTTRMTPPHGTQTTATVTVRVPYAVLTGTASGAGPVHALDAALRQCLSGVYPGISNVRLTDYKVRVLEPNKGTAAKVRVLIEWSGKGGSWSTVGVSENVIEASWRALVDAIRLELMRASTHDKTIRRPAEDYCWGV